MKKPTIAQIRKAAGSDVTITRAASTLNGRSTYRIDGSKVIYTLDDLISKFY
jgi:chromosome segregation ATPase